MSTKSTDLEEALSLNSMEALVRAVVRLEGRLRLAFAPLNDVCVGGAQAHGLLQSLAIAGPQSISRLARSRHVSRQWMQRAVAALVAIELVEFIANPRHKQARLVRISSKGLEMVQELNVSAEPILRALCPEDISLDAMHTALSLLGRISARLDDVLSRPVQSHARKHHASTRGISSRALQIDRKTAAAL